VDRVIAVGRRVAASRVCREGVPRSRITLIPNGVRPPGEETLAGKHAAREALRKTLDLPPGAGPILLMVGNLRPMKGHGEALEAINRLIPSHPRIRLVVVGRDVSGGTVAERARQLGCSKHVVWMGYQENTEPFYAASDLYLMPSYWEGCPTALLEAMAWRLPIVASRVGGIAALARDGREACLVPPKDSAALARALASLLEDPARGDALAHAARKRVLGRYTLVHMIDAHETLYRDLVRKVSAPRL